MSVNTREKTNKDHMEYNSINNYYPDSHRLAPQLQGPAIPRFGCSLPLCVSFHCYMFNKNPKYNVQNKSEVLEP